MLRFLFRVWLALVLFFLGLLFGRRRDARLGDPPSGGRARRSRQRPGAMPPIDRSDVVDVPFTEIPPPGDATGPERAAASPGPNVGAPESAAGLS